MFISNAHKDLIEQRLKNLEIENKYLKEKLENVSKIAQEIFDQVQLISGNFPAKKKAPEGKKRLWSVEKREAQAERMRKLWQEKKAKAAGVVV